jgi:hypothetical protein
VALAPGTVTAAGGRAGGLGEDSAGCLRLAGGAAANGSSALRLRLRMRLRDGDHGSQGTDVLGKKRRRVGVLHNGAVEVGLPPVWRERPGSRLSVGTC